MAEDGFTVQIDDELAGEVRAAAAAKEIPVEIFVRDALSSHVGAESQWSADTDPATDERIVAETLRQGDGVAWEVFRERLKVFGRRPG
jgi:hypothetical protein